MKSVSRVIVRLLTDYTESLYNISRKNIGSCPLTQEDKSFSYYNKGCLAVYKTTNRLVYLSYLNVKNSFKYYVYAEMCFKVDFLFERDFWVSTCLLCDASIVHVRLCHLVKRLGLVTADLVFNRKFHKISFGKPLDVKN